MGDSAPGVARIATGVLCFVLSLLFYYGTVLRVELKRTDLLDLGPYPDAVEYFAQANSILKEGAPTIQIGYDKLPSRYPPGYPLLMVPWLKFCRHSGILAPFRTNQTVGLLLLMGSFAFYFVIGRALAGGLATLLLATQPAFVSFSRSSMSDLSGAAAAVLAFALVYLGLAWRAPLADLLCSDCSWPVFMYTATVVVHGTIIGRHGFVSGQRFLAQVVHALLSCPCGIRGSFRSIFHF